MSKKEKGAKNSAHKSAKKSERAGREEKTLTYWRENNIFEKTLEKKSSEGEFIFYEGPPTANGRPGIHHIESRAFKDAIPRYKTMRGFHVRRKAGWDTHGLPVEIEVEKELGISSKKEIEEYGIDKFNEKCKENVWKYVDEWRQFTERVGYWLDLDNPYITYSPDYMETLWWITKQVDEKKLLYKDYKVVPWCPRCGTALSSHELAQGYEDVKDLSVTARFKLTETFDEKDVSVIAWTTTPWTLPGNVALAVGNDVKYGLYEVKADEGSEYLIIAQERAEEVLSDKEHSLIKDVSTDELVGLSYEPLYPYLNDLAESEKGMEKAYKVYEADFVTIEDGTGIVHTAVMYGQDDFELGNTVGLPKFHLVDEEGHFVKGTDFLEGRFVKKEETDVEIIKDLHHRGLLFSKAKYEHSYPHCWRCKTPLIYYARDSWYIRTTDIKDKLIKENEDINWEPAHIKGGRFGEWLENLRDWAISRERYWGTPLPVWQNESGDKRVVIGSIEELKQKTKSTNNYFLMRHGEAEHNVDGRINATNENPSHLTDNGRKIVAQKARNLNQKIDIIYHSPLIRAKETAEIIAGELGVAKDFIFEDKRLREYDFGDLEGKPLGDYWDFRKDQGNYYEKATPGGESFLDVKKRAGNFLYEIDTKHAGKTILLVGHGATLEVVPAVVEGADHERSFEIMRELQQHKPEPAYITAFEFSRIPHNEKYELDLHRPYIDEITWEEGGETYTRTPEVMDVWFDSGAMPFAQDHYPFDINEKELQYPADYISEAIDQTRGWFYTLHAVGNLLGKGRAYKNVICLGHILDAEGQKMSKSKGNTVDPWEASDEWGVDVLRFWMYSVNAPGESKNFDLETVDEVNKKVFNLLENILRFYEMFSVKTDRKAEESGHILDRWILALLNELTQKVTKGLESYDLMTPTRAIRDFIGDFSQWYIRRSRDRFKNGDEDAEYASATTRYVLTELSKLIAPFAPFMAEHVYRSIGGEKESVHLESWPEEGEVDKEVLEKMKRTRNIISNVFEARDKVNIKVRQPLQKLRVNGERLEEEYIEEIKQEANVKEVNFDMKVEIADKLGVTDKVELDTVITPELKAEGQMREIVREIQKLRKKEGLDPADSIVLTVKTDDEGKGVIEKFKEEITQTAGIEKLSYGEVEGEHFDADGVEFSFEIEKK